MVAATGVRRNALNWPVIEATTFHAPKIDVQCEANEYLHLPVKRHRGLRQALLGPEARPYFGETI